MLIAGLAFLGWTIGFFSIPQETPAEASPTTWEYKLPKLTSSFADAYRAEIVRTGQTVADVMQAHPHSPTSVASLALLHYLSHDGEGEERCWRRCLELDPTYSLAYTRLVALAQQKGHYDRIVELMQQAMRDNPDERTYRALLGSALMYQNRPAEARRELERVLSEGHATADIYLLLGEVNYQLGKHSKAKRCFSLAVDLDPERADALHGLVKACTKLGQQSEANEHALRLEGLKTSRLTSEATRDVLQDETFVPPRIAEIVTLAGKSYLQAGDLTTAEQLFRQAAATSERDVESRQLLIQLDTAASRWNSALETTQELRQIEPHNTLHFWNEGILYERAEKLDDAERVFREFCRTRPADDAGYAALAALFFRNQRKTNEARALAEQAVELAPTARNWWLLGSIANSQGDRSAARIALKNAVDLEPENKELLTLYESLSTP
jgi:tetratricopeptide (TPR) repeat protein